MLQDMKILIIVLAALIIIGGVYFVIKMQPNDPEEKNVDTTATSSISSTPEAKGITHAVITTTKGAITFELYEDRAPKTVGNFLKLVREGFYNGIKIHRLVPNFIVQFGDPLSKTLPLTDPRIGTGGPGYTIEDEFDASLSNVTGTISMANTGAPHTGGSQVFINLVDNAGLDFNKEPLTSKHAVFGKVVKGMDVVSRLEVGDIILSIAQE